MDSPTPNADRTPCFAGRLCAELKRLALLAIVVGLVVIAGKYYCFDRLNEEIRARFENQLRAHYEGLSVTVKSVRRVPGRGVEIRGLRIMEAGGKGAPILAEIDEIFAQCDTRIPDFLTKPLQITALQIHRLKLRAERKPSGRWNLSHLLPLPPCQGSCAPIATITDAAVEIVDPAQQPAGALILRNIELTARPEIAAGTSAIVLRVRGTLSGDHFESVELDGILDPTSGGWDIRGAVQGLEFSPRLRAALPRELSEAVAPIASIRGRTYFGFQASRGGYLITPLPSGGSGASAAADAPRESQSVEDTLRTPNALIDHAARGAPLSPRERGQAIAPPVQFVVHGKISDGRIDDARLPEPLTDVEANIRCDNHAVRIDDLSARCGSTQLELHATMAGYSGNGPVEMELTARQLQLDHLPTATLPPAVRDTWAHFRPRGLVDVIGRLRFDGNQWLPDLKIACDDLSVTYDRFPYRLTDGSGTIIVKPDWLLVHLRTAGGGRTIRCQADIRNPGPQFTGWIELQSEGPIAIDDRLIGAMDGPTQRLVRSFHPRGTASFLARFERKAGDAGLQRRLEIALHDCSIQHERFPYPIDRVSGSLVQAGGNWLFKGLRGQNDSAEITGEGWWSSGEREGGKLALQFAARDVPLADELRQALPPAAQRLWTNLQPRGNIDHLLIDLSYRPSAQTATGQPWSIEIQAEKSVSSGEGRAISLEPVWFRYALNNVTGGFRYHDGQMVLSNLRAAHGRANLAAESGTCSILPTGGFRVELTKLAADHLEVDRELLAALPAGVGTALARFPLEGPLNAWGKLGIVVPPEPNLPPQLAWDFGLDVENGRLLTATPIEHLCGELSLNGRHGRDGLFARGELKFESSMIRGIQLTNLQGPFWCDGQRVVFGALADRDTKSGAPRQITARVLAGLLSLDGELALQGDSPFDVQATLANADLAEIARQLAPHQQGLSGRVFGLVRVGGNSQGKHTWHGDGQISLREANLYELPAMINLLKILSVQRPSSTAFTNSNIDFRIEGDDLAFERIDFSGDAISLKGKGRMNGQRQIDLQFYPLVGREERHLPIFRPLLGQTGQEFMLIEVKGTVDQPEIHRQVFPRLDARLAQLFPELARDEAVERNAPAVLSPREALNRLRPFPRR